MQPSGDKYVHVLVHVHGYDLAYGFEFLELPREETPPLLNCLFEVGYTELQWKSTVKRPLTLLCL